MSDHAQIRLVLFLTRSTPLATWHKVGIIAYGTTHWAIEVDGHVAPYVL